MSATVRPTHHHSEVGGIGKISARRAGAIVELSRLLQIEKAHNFSPWHLDPALTAEVLSVPRLTVSHKWKERGMRWKHLTSMVFGKLNGRTWVKKKKVRAAQQLQSARGVCVKKESTLKWLFSLAVYLDKTKRSWTHLKCDTEAQFTLLPRLLLSQ